MCVCVLLCFLCFLCFGCVCVCVLFCFFCFDLVCVCVLAGSAFCMLFCFGLVCVCVCFASFVLIWSVCVCVLAGFAFCTSFCFVWCRLVRVCVVCRLSCCFFVFCVMGWFGFFALLWLVPVCYNMLLANQTNTKNPFESRTSTKTTPECPK